MNRIPILLVLLAGSVAGCYRHPPWPSPHTPKFVSCRPLAAPRHDIAGDPNFARVSETFFRSGQPTEEGFRWLGKEGVKTVVNLRYLHSDRDALKGTGLRYARIHCHTFKAEDEDVIRFLKIVTDPSHQPVLVHCKHGSDRTGMMVAAYRVYVEGWELEEALLELPRFGFHKQWRNLITYLRKLDIEALRKKVEEADPFDVDRIE